MSTPPYSIGSDVFNGLSKLVEEAGEVLQVVGKLMGTGGTRAHWDGTDLYLRIQEEVADLMAAAEFFASKNLDLPAVEERKRKKLDLFHQWDQGQREKAP